MVEKSSTRKPDQGALQETQQLQLTAEMTTALHRFARQHRLTMNTLIQGAWALLLSRYSGKNDVVFGIATSGRPVSLKGVEEIVGLFINTLPLRVHLEPDHRLVDWLQALQAQQLEMLQYEYSPLVQIQQWSDVPSGQPLFQSLLGFENFPDLPSSDEEQEFLAVGRRNVGSFSETNYPICVLALPDKELSLQIIYDRERFEPAPSQRLLQQLETLLTSFLTAEEHACLLKDLSLLNAAERRLILHDWNQTHRTYPHSASLPELFEAQVARTPDAIALCWHEEQVSYHALNACANQLARLFQHEGVQPGQLVGLYLQRSPVLLIGLLALLKAGAAYLPLDLSSPAERVGLMLKDAQVSLLLSEQRLLTSLPAEAARVLCLDTLGSRLPAYSAEDLRLPLNSQYPAYVIYTSGSTGVPKGVSVPQQAVARLVLNTTFAQLDAQQRCLHLAPVSFDAATLEIWGPWLNGGRLALFPESLPTLEGIAQQVQREAITLLWLTAGLFHQMVEHHLETLAQVPQVLAGGEVLSASHVRRVLEAGAGTCLINGYGPTENTTFTCCYPMGQPEQVGASVPIGRPIANTRVYVLDEQLDPVPVGVPGELYAAGDGLAMGYHQEPAMTGARFVPDPWSGQPGARMYRTGDLVRYRPDGLIEFLGRGDQQVKLHGFRIELGEIEAALSQHPAVRQALVLLREDHPADKRLVAYLVAQPLQEVSAQELRAFLREHLPTYMIPAFYISLTELPLTPNGKIDRRALPTPEQVQQNVGEEFVAPRDALEAQLTQIWEEMLDVRPIGVCHNFFDIGGHSLHAVSLIAKIQKQMGQKLPLSVLFQRPTIEQIADVLRQRSSVPSRSPLVAIHPHGSKRPFFAVHPGSGDVFCYYDLARSLGSDQPFYALEDPDIHQQEFPYVPLEMMAARYIKAVKDIQAEGPYLLGGYSFGGHVAFEMARQLRQQGQRVDMLAIFDTTVPAIISQMPQDEASLLTTVIMELLQDSARKSAGEMYSELQTLTQDEQFTYALQQVQAAKIELPDSPASWLRLQVQIFRTRMHTIQHYHPEPYPGPIVLFRSSQVEEFGDVRKELLDQFDYGWHELSRQVEVYTIEGYHDTILLEPHVQALAEHLKFCLDTVQTTYQGVIS